MMHTAPQSSQIIQRACLSGRVRVQGSTTGRQLQPRQHRQTRWWRELCAALKTLGALSLLGDAIRAQPVDPDRSSSLRGTGFLPAPNQCEPSSDTAAAESGTGERDSSRHAAGLRKCKRASLLRRVSVQCVRLPVWSCACLEPLGSDGEAPGG